MEAFRHPWPFAAEHAAEAIVALDRIDLAPQLADAAPTSRTRRLPFERREDKGKKTIAVREVVEDPTTTATASLCHAPALDAEKLSARTSAVARVPSPDEPLQPMTSRVYYESFGPRHAG